MGRSERWWRRTRIGLALSAIGLLVSWIPIVAVFGAFFLSFGSTFLFLGAKAAGRRHEVAVVVAFLALAIGGVIVGVLVSAFSLEALEAARQGLPMRSLQEPANLMLWATLPASFALAAGFGLQVVYLIPRRSRTLLLLLSISLILTAIATTWLAAPEVTALNEAPVRGATYADFMIRISVYRMIEAPAYVGLAILYLASYWNAMPGIGSFQAVPMRFPDEG